MVRVSPSSRPMAAACGAQGSGSCSPCGGGPAGSQQRRRYDGAALAGAERARSESAATCAAVPPPVPRPSATAGWPAPGGAAGGPRAPESVELAGVAPEEDGLGQGPQPRPAAGRPESGSRRGVPRSPGVREAGCSGAPRGPEALGGGSRRWGAGRPFLPSLGPVASPSGWGREPLSLRCPPHTLSARPRTRPSSSGSPQPLICCHSVTEHPARPPHLRHIHVFIRESVIC